MRKRSIAGLGVLVMLALSGCSEPVSPATEDEGCLDTAYALYSMEEESPTVEVFPPHKGVVEKFGDLLLGNEEKGVCETTHIVSQTTYKQPAGSAFSEWYYGVDKVTPNESGTCNFVVDDEVVTEPCVLVSVVEDPKFQKALLAEVSEQYSSGDWGDDALKDITYYKIGSREPVVK